MPPIWGLLSNARSSWNGSANDTTTRSWRPNGSRRPHGSWGSDVWTHERATSWRPHATNIKHGSRGSQASLAPRGSRSDVTIPPSQSWLRRPPTWSWPWHPYHGLSQRACQRRGSSLHDEECANVRGKRTGQQWWRRRTSKRRTGPGQHEKQPDDSPDDPERRRPEPRIQHAQLSTGRRK